MIVLAFWLLVSFAPPTEAAATDYPQIMVEERIRQLSDAKTIAAAQSQAAQATSDAFENEKKIIAQQIDIITGDEDTKYVIVPGDTVQVSYNDRGDRIQNIYQVSAKGAIHMPLIGEVKISGFNRGQARERLNVLMTEYIRQPQLTIDINTAGKYLVMGAAGPGVFALQPDLHLMEALIKAGINQGRANLANVFVFRRGGQQKPQILRLNLKKMMLHGDTTDDIPLKPNDIIYVPDTLFFDIDAFKDKLFEYITDYYTLGGNNILKSNATKGF